MAAIMVFDEHPWDRNDPPPDFNAERVRQLKKGGHVAQHKAERDRAKFPRKRKSR